MNKNILIIKLGAIGDVLMITPALKLIRKINPGAKITLLVGKIAKEIIEENPNVDEIIEVDETIFWKKKIFKIIKLILQIRQKKFDTGINMHWSKMFNLFMLFAGIKKRIGFIRHAENKKFTDFLTTAVRFFEGEKNTIENKYLHMSEQYISLIKSMHSEKYDKLNFPYDKYEIFISEDIKKRALSMIPDNYKDKDIYCICPGGGDNPKSKMESRRWPIEKFIELSKLIFEKNKSSVIFYLGSKNDYKNFSQSIDSNLKEYDTRIFNLMGKTTLKESAVIMSKSKSVVTNDSAALHLASALDVKTISIFGPTVPYDKVLQRKQNIYIYKSLPCSPCYKYGQFPDCKNIRCLNEISPDEVLNVIFN